MARLFPPLLTGSMLLSLAGIAFLAGHDAVWARVDADPQKEYVITPEVGPWTICAASFVGETAQKLAHSLVLELRTKYDLPAYVFNRGAEERQAQKTELDKRRQQQREYLQRMGLNPDVDLPVRTVRIDDQYAVLIGGYPDIDAAHHELERIKKLDAPESVHLDSAAQGFRVLEVLGIEKHAAQQGKPVSFNPFLKSFVVRNPTVASDHTRDLGFLKELNEDESYSLLTCPKHWTLLVKNFQGTVVVPDKVQPGSFWDKLGVGGSDMMTVSAKQGHEVAKALRAMHFEAFVLHTRYGSLVTVGGYDTDKDAQLLQNQKCLANLRFGIIQLYAQPVPMEVPRG